MSRTKFAALALILLILVAIETFQYVKMNNAHPTDLLTMRSVINQYTLDKQHAPRSLDELVEAGYLRSSTVSDKDRQDVFREAASQ